MSLFANNSFGHIFQEFDEAAHFKRLHEQVRVKPYYKKYKSFKNTLLVLSFVFNIASALTACFAAYWIAKWLTGYEAIAVFVAVIFLVFLEQIKRKSSSEFWQVWFFNKEFTLGWAALSIMCFLVSLGSSSFGVNEGVEEMGPGAEVIKMDSTAQEYRQQIKNLEQDNIKLESQKNAQGEIYWPAQKEKEENKKLIADLQRSVIALDQKLEGENIKLSSEYREEQKMTQQILIIATIVFELLFEFCILYVWYFHYRTYTETKLTKGIPEDKEQKISFKYNGSVPSLNFGDVSPTPLEDIPNLLKNPAVVQQLLKLLQQTDVQHDENYDNLKEHLQHLNNSSNNIADNKTSIEDNTFLLQQLEGLLQQEKSFNLPIGFYSKEDRRKQMEQTALFHNFQLDQYLLQQVESIVRKQNSLLHNLPQELRMVDQFSILHFDFRNGKPIRYAIGRVNGLVKDYERRVAETPSDNNKSKLLYWKLRKAELNDKCNICTE